MNGNTNGTGIVPTIDLATNNNAYPYPAYPFYGNNNNDGFFNGEGIWAIILLALLFGNGAWGGFGGFGGFGGGFGGMYEFPWLLTGQQAINNNTNNGFDTLHLSNQLEGNRDAINNLSTQLCGCCGDISNQISTNTASVTNALTNGFYNAEVAACNRQIADMNQNFTNQLNLQNNLNALNSRFSDCCCENRLANCQTQNTIISESANTRYANANNTRDIIESNNRNSQAILDKLCQLELDNMKTQLDAKNDLIDQLRQENLYARGQASQVQQTAELRNSQATTANLLVSELRSCPIPSQPVYGNTPIFTCNGYNTGCGCNGTSQFI